MWQYCCAINDIPHPWMIRVLSNKCNYWNFLMQNIKNLPWIFGVEDKSPPIRPSVRQSAKFNGRVNRIINDLLALAPAGTPPPIRSAVENSLDQFQLFVNGLSKKVPSLSLDEITTQALKGLKLHLSVLGKNLMLAVPASRAQFRGICEPFCGVVLEYLSDDKSPNNPQLARNACLSFMQKFEDDFPGLYSEVRVSKCRTNFICVLVYIFMHSYLLFSAWIA